MQTPFCVGGGAWPLGPL